MVFVSVANKVFQKARRGGRFVTIRLVALDGGLFWCDRLKSLITRNAREFSPASDGRVVAFLSGNSKFMIAWPSTHCLFPVTVMLNATSTVV